MANVAPKSALAAREQVVRAIVDALENLPAPVVQLGDELRPIAALAEEWGLEVAGLTKAIKRAGVPTVKIGRARAVRRSDVVALVDTLAERRPPPPSPSDDAYADLVEQQTRGARR